MGLAKANFNLSANHAPGRRALAPVVNPFVSSMTGMKRSRVDITDYAIIGIGVIVLVFHDIVLENVRHVTYSFFLDLSTHRIA